MNTPLNKSRANPLECLFGTEMPLNDSFKFKLSCMKEQKKTPKVVERYCTKSKDAVILDSCIKVMSDV